MSQEQDTALFDQPEPKKRKPKKKGVVPSFTPAQVIMRDDIIGSVVDGHDSQGNSYPEPEPLGFILDSELFGERPQKPVGTLSRYGQQQARAKQIALDIIDQYELVLSLKQWQVVQNMVEQGIMTGVQLELDGLDP